MPKFSSVLNNITDRFRTRAQFAENLEQWERLATPDELEQYREAVDLTKAA